MERHRSTREQVALGITTHNLVSLEMQVCVGGEVGTGLGCQLCRQEPHKKDLSQGT